LYETKKEKKKPSKGSFEDQEPNKTKAQMLWRSKGQSSCSMNLLVFFSPLS
jgi:hypothetical protein